ncbi:MAG TPA: hypothetical protein PKL65_05555 [Bacteroidales bacterium]|nr:dioxygenase [Bacteroidales bacterium]HNR41679.1 hypothetical protein [Bacteroidales bacterium]HPM18877.1 hypothetical protein [Bacteroidales bacterium]HPV16276.1 hypothetical protein [Bacteroidales bacterium]
MQKEYFIFIPGVAGTFEEEWGQCFAGAAEKTGEGYRLIKLNVFIDPENSEIYLRQKKFIENFLKNRLGDQCPAISVITQPPEDPWKISAEGMFIRAGTTEVTTKFWGSVPYVVLGPEPGKELWAAGLGDDELSENTRSASVKSFEMMSGILDQEGMSYNNLVRQWNYVGEILKISRRYQNYQTFNEVRSEYYSKYRTAPGFPAATGIGMKIGGVIIDFCAIQDSPAVRTRPIDNPKQVNAYQYSQKVLKGLKVKGKPIKNPPQFERALFVANGDKLTLFVSGTASIIGQDTIGKENIKEQTHITIENIKRLSEITYLGELTGYDLSHGKCTLIRAYVKRQEYFSAVKDICREQFPGVPAIYTEADVCRDDLLVEIEAEYAF